MIEDKITEEYREEIKINKYHLDDELIEQAALYIRWAEKAAEAVGEKIRIEKQRNILKAKLYKKYRSEFETDATKRVTDSQIDSYVRTDPEYIRMTNEYIEAVKDESIMLEVKWGFQQRKSLLEDLQQGIIAGLYSDPREGKQEKTKEDIHKRLNRR